MAWDETLLDMCGELKRPTLRLYAWTEPAATFGYFQHFTDVARWTSLRPLIRRPTGGGLVPHNADWTYSLAFPPGHPWYDLRATESYEQVHQWIRRSFEKLGVETNLAPCCQKEVPGQCFVGAEKFDVLWKGRKVAGAAQRRNRMGLLIQGSIQSPAGVERPSWEDAFLSTEPDGERLTFQELKPDQRMEDRVQALTEQKYSRADYNQRR